MSVADALAAESGGADRLEIVSALTEGGLTPSYGMLAAIRRATSLPIYVMIRPRGGHFTYSPTEVGVMAEDARIARELGADGLVVGALTLAGAIDVAAIRQVTEQGHLPITFHRAFEHLADKRAGLRQLAELPGVERVLTSGGGGSPLQNAALLRELDQAAHPIEIMVGAGVTLENAQEIIRATGVRALHTGSAVREPQSPTGTVSAERVARLRRLLDEA